MTMSSRIIPVLCAAVAFVLFHGSQCPSATAQESLNGLLEPILAQHETPALAAAVIHKGQTVAVGAVGLRKVRSDHHVTVDDRFHLGSCTKSMTATLCGMLVEQGKLRWDATIGETFADISGRIDPAFREVTLEQLLCHRSGLPEDRRPDFVVFPQLVALQGEMLSMRREMVAIAMGRPPAHPVGGEFAYSNIGFAIAGTMCEAATGERYETLMRRMIFEPLDMKTAGFGPPGGTTVDEPRGHTSLFGWLRPIPPGPGSDNVPLIAPAGTVHCSLPDWAKYVALHLDVERDHPGLLTKKTLAKLHSDPFDQNYGFGWGISRPKWSNREVVSHGGSNSLWIAKITLAPHEGLGILTATNLATAESAKACQEAEEAIRGKYLSQEE
jgi:CubicO group peptidase (beta-lactamase class C family)